MKLKLTPQQQGMLYRMRKGLKLSTEKYQPPCWALRPF